MEISIKKEDLQNKRLFVATPMYGGQNHGLYMKACLDLQGMCMQYGIQVKFSFLFNESLITRARNYLVDEFIHRSDCTHMLFIDSDIHFNPQDVIALLALDKDVAGGHRHYRNAGGIAPSSRSVRAGGRQANPMLEPPQAVGAGDPELRVDFSHSAPNVYRCFSAATTVGQWFLQLDGDDSAAGRTVDSLRADRFSKTHGG